MTEIEQPSDAQIALGLKMGIQNPHTFTKSALRQAISEKIEERKGSTPKPQNYKISKDSNGKEFHLTIEQQRIAACQLALEVVKMAGQDVIFEEQRDKFFNYIHNGN